MAKEERVSLWLTLKDGATKVLEKIKGTGNKFSAGMKTAMTKVTDAFKSTMFSAVALGTAMTQMLFKAIASIKQWAGEAKTQFQTFEKSLAAVYTLLDKDTFNKHAKDLEAGAIKIMQEFNLSIQDVNKALFDAVSAGVEAGEATEFLEQAARLAKGGVTDLSVAVDGMTSIMNAYGLETEDAAKVSDALFTAQKFGKTTVAELSANIGKVAPIAKAAGVSFQELLAATSQLTLSGISTDEAVTALKGAFQSIITPTDDAAKKFTELGIPIGKAAFEGGKFGETMEKIKNSTDSNIDVISELIPNIRGLLAITSVATETGLQKYDDILKEVKSDHDSLTEALAKQMATTEELIATERSKMIPAQMKIGKLLSQMELGWLRLANSVLKVKNIWEASIGVYATVYNHLKRIADKIAETTGLRRAEVEAEREALDEVLATREELVAKDLIAKQKKLENDALYLEKKAEIEAIAEEARIEFEEQKKEYDRLTADEKIALLEETLGRERIAKDSQRINELVKVGKHEKAKALQEKIFTDAYAKMNVATFKKMQDAHKKHWAFIITGAKLNAKERKAVDSAMSQFLQDTMLLLGKESIAAFRLMQGVAISQTIMKTYEAAQNAFTALSSIPIIGPVLGGVAAGAAVVAGLARVDQIRRQKPPQAETGGHVAGSGVAVIHKGEDIITEQQREGLASGGLGGAQNIYLQMDEETLQKWIIRTDEESAKMGRAGIR
jgi:TP901 family phage tail tape measure protein